MARRAMHEAAPMGGATPADPIGAILRAFEDRYNQDPSQFMGRGATDEYQGEPPPPPDLQGAPVEEFADPQTTIGTLLRLMQGQANRSRP